MLQGAVTNLNRTLDEHYIFDPGEFERKRKLKESNQS
jgi:hypothetical protein